MDKSRAIIKYYEQLDPVKTVCHLAYKGHLPELKIYIDEHPDIDLWTTLLYARKRENNEEIIQYLESKVLRLDRLNRDMIREVAQYDPSVYNTLTRVDKRLHSYLRDMSQTMFDRYGRNEAKVYTFDIREIYKNDDPSDIYETTYFPNDIHFNQKLRELVPRLMNTDIRHGDVIYIHTRYNNLILFWDGIKKEIVYPDIISDRYAVPDRFRVGHMFNPTYWSKALEGTNNYYTDSFWPDKKIAADAYKRLTFYKYEMIPDLSVGYWSSVSNNHPTKRSKVYSCMVRLGNKEYKLICNERGYQNASNGINLSWTARDYYYDDNYDTGSEYFHINYEGPNTLYVFQKKDNTG